MALKSPAAGPLSPYFPGTAGERWLHFSFRVNGSRQATRHFAYQELAPALATLKNRGLVARSSFLILSSVTVYLKVSRKVPAERILSGLLEALSPSVVEKSGFTLNEGSRKIIASNGERVGDLRGLRTIDLYLWQACLLHQALWDIRDEVDEIEVGLASILFLLDVLGIPASERASAINRWIDDFSSFCATNEDSLEPDPAAGMKVRESLTRARLPEAFFALTRTLAQGGWQATPTPALAQVFRDHERSLRRIGRVLSAHRGDPEFFPAKFPRERAIFCNYIHFHLFNIGWNGDRELLLYWALAGALVESR